MNANDHLLFSATRQTVSPPHQEAMLFWATNDLLDWYKVFDTAEKGHVAPLVYRNLVALPQLSQKLPLDLHTQNKKRMLATSLYKRERALQLDTVINFFHENQIPIMLIKGAAQDHLIYDQSWYTTYEDIDLIIKGRPENLDPKLVRKISDTLYRGKIEYDYYEHHDFNMNGMLPIDFQDVWSAARILRIHDKEIFVLSPEDHLISIAINSCRKRFFRLKSLLDIQETISRLKNLDWQKFIQRSQSFCCENIIYTALAVTSKTLGGDIPEEVFRALRLSSTRKKVIGLCINILMKNWSLTEDHLIGIPLNKTIDPTLLLKWATFYPHQIRYRSKLAERRHSVN
jgi:hypothetical protein